MLKSIPQAEYRLLFPPVRDSDAFRYFENCEAHPFRPDAAGFELVNAWWLAEMSLLAYAGPDVAVPIFERAGLEVAGRRPIVGGAAQCYVVYNDRFVAAVFRGTQTLRPDRWEQLRDAWRNLVDVAADVRADVKVRFVQWAGNSARFVHRGFHDALEAMWLLLQAQLRELQLTGPQRTFWFAGHSLGAALATLAAARFSGARTLYTFGSPRVGDAAFADGYPAPAHRIVNGTDFVPRLPTLGQYPSRRMGLGKYRHVGQLHYIAADGSLSDDASRWDRLEDWFRGQRQHVVDAVRGLFNNHPLALAPADLNDHAPLLYALRVWNLYAAERDGRQPP